MVYRLKISIAMFAMMVSAGAFAQTPAQVAQWERQVPSMRGRIQNGRIVPALDFSKAGDRLFLRLLLKSDADVLIQSVLSNLSVSGILMIQSQEPSLLVETTQIKFTATNVSSMIEFSDRVMDVLAPMREKFRTFVLSAVKVASVGWMTFLADTFSSMPFRAIQEQYGPALEPVFRALAVDLENISSLGRMLFLAPATTPAESLDQYLRILEGKLYDPALDKSARQDAADQLLMRITNRIEKSPAVMKLFERIHAADLLTTNQQLNFLNGSVRYAGLNSEVKAWIQKQRSILSGDVVEPWREPYLPQRNTGLVVLPLTSFQQHQIATFDPVGAYIEARKVQEQIYKIHYSQARQALHDQIMKPILAKGSKSASPKFVATAGPLGSGKNTSLSRLVELGKLDLSQYVKIDADEIRDLIPEYKGFQAKFPVYAASLVQHEVMDICDLLLEAAMQDGKNVLLNTSLRNAEHFSRFFERMKKMRPQYSRTLISIKASPELILQVNQNPQSRGGRVTNIEQAIRSIQEVDESVQTLKPYFDEVMVVNNFGARPELESITVKQRPRNNSLIYSFFDIDWTLYSPMPESLAYYREHIIGKYPGEDPWKWVEADGQVFRVAEDLEELLETYMKDPQHRMGIATGGTPARVIELLKKTLPPLLNGRSMYDFADLVFCSDALVPGIAGAKQFSAANKKNLNVEILGTKHFALFDDQKGFIQQLNHFGADTGKSYQYFPTFAEAKAALGDRRFDQRYVPKTYEEWWIDRHRLGRFSKIMSQARKSMSGTSKAFGKLVQETAQLISRMDFFCDKSYQGNE